MKDMTAIGTAQTILAAGKAGKKVMDLAPNHRYAGGNSAMYRAAAVTERIGLEELFRHSNYRTVLSSGSVRSSGAFLLSSAPGRPQV